MTTKYIINADLVQGLYNYLGMCPCKDVFHLVKGLTELIKLEVETDDCKSEVLPKDNYINNSEYKGLNN